MKFFLFLKSRAVNEFLLGSKLGLKICLFLSKVDYSILDPGIYSKTRLKQRPDKESFFGQGSQEIGMRKIQNYLLLEQL